MRVTREQAEAWGWAEALDRLGSQEPDPPKVRTAKYRNQITTYRGVKYHSKLEANYAGKLDGDADAGLIRCWFRQVDVRLGVPENRAVVDFLVIGHGDAWFVECKGKETAKWLRDRKLWAAYGPLRLLVVRRGGVDEVIVPESMRREGPGDG